MTQAKQFGGAYDLDAVKASHNLGLLDAARVQSLASEVRKPDPVRATAFYKSFSSLASGLTAISKRRM